MPSLTVTLTKAQMQRLEKESSKRVCATRGSLVRLALQYFFEQCDKDDAENKRLMAPTALTRRVRDERRDNRNAVMARREVRQQFGRGRRIESPIVGPPNIKAKS